MKRILLRIAAVLVVLWLLAVAGLAWAMRQPVETFGRVMSHVPMPAMMVLPFETLWTNARGGKLHVGDAAPDFTLLSHDKQSAVQLSSFRGKQPLVLVFGSYT